MSSLNSIPTSPNPSAEGALPPIIIISGPSGIGKTTLATHLEARYNFHLPVSHTTRPPRDGEEDGKDYYFVSDGFFDAFDRTTGLFIEKTVSPSGKRYGLSVRELAAPGSNIPAVVCVDYAGKRQISEYYGSRGLLGKTIQGRCGSCICSCTYTWKSNLSVLLLPEDYGLLAKRIYERDRPVSAADWKDFLARMEDAEKFEDFADYDLVIRGADLMAISEIGDKIYSEFRI